MSKNQHLAPADSPVEVDVCTRRNLTNSGVTANGSPDLFLKLARCNIIAKERVVYSSQHNATHIW
jgi:hypothetical protein